MAAETTPRLRESLSQFAVREQTTGRIKWKDAQIGRPETSIPLDAPRLGEDGDGVEQAWSNRGAEMRSRDSSRRGADGVEVEKINSVNQGRIEGDLGLEKAGDRADSLGYELPCMEVGKNLKRASDD
jgi:hypothetical protein